jgi:hypothetical protein
MKFQRALLAVAFGAGVVTTGGITTSATGTTVPPDEAPGSTEAARSRRAGRRPIGASTRFEGA